MPETDSTTRQWALIRRWLADLREIPAVDVVWLEGSLADGRGNPYSDIDIRFAIADEEYEQLWTKPIQRAFDASSPESAQGPSTLLAGLGNYLLLETAFVRALTADGLLVEAGAIFTSQTDSLELYEWEILFSRLPQGAPAFRQAHYLPPAQAWPETEPLTSAYVWQRTKFLLLMLLHTPAVFHLKELHSVLYTLDLARGDLLKLMWRRSGLRMGKRAKHMSEIFPANWLTSITDTYPRKPTVLSSLVAPLVRIYELQAEHLRALADEVGGGFPVTWYERHYTWLRRELGRVISDEPDEFHS